MNQAGINSKLRVILLTLAITAFSLFLPLPDTFLRQPESGRQTVLFIGNSLTFVHDIPYLTRRLAHDQGVELFVDAATYPAFELSQHLEHGPTMDKLKSRRWDYVVIQEGSRPVAYFQEESREAMQRFVPLLRQHSQRVILYSILSGTWSKDLRENAAQFHACAAEELGWELAPVSAVWNKVQMRWPQFPIFDPDNHHPGPGGALLAAAIFDQIISARPGLRIDSRLESPQLKIIDLLFPQSIEIDHGMIGEINAELSKADLRSLLHCENSKIAANSTN